MMRGPSYDDNYIARKMTSMQSSPTFMPPGSSQGRGPSGGYMQNDPYEEESYECTPDVIAPLSKYAYTPSARTQQILRNVARTQPRGYGHVPPPRCAPRMAPPPPPYYDDYYGGGGGGGGGYGGGYSPYAGYGYGGGYYQPPPPPPMPRYGGYSPYTEDDYEPYSPRYRPTPRLTDTLLELEGAKPEDNERAARKTRLRAIEPSQQVESEGDRHMARMAHKYPSLSEPQMLQDQVDKMRIRLKALSFTLDPSGPVPEIIVPTRSRRLEDEDLKKKYTSALEVAELPRLSTRRHHYYPEDDHMKENLRIKCLSHYKSTRTQAEYWKPKNYRGDEVSAYSSPSYSFRTVNNKGDDAAKWEEPDKVYATSSNTEKKPYSKTADATEEEDAKKERRKKKKSRDLEELSSIAEATPAKCAEASIELPAAAPVAEVVASVAGVAADGQVSAPSESAAPEVDAELDEKERKRLEKKKRKAEREAAAKAAMEAELAALAEAEAELAKLEAESASIKVEEEPKASEEQASEPPADKCESQFEFQEFECEPSSFDVNESLQEHEIDQQVPDDPEVIEETYEAVAVEEEPHEEQPKVTEEEISAMLDEETVTPQIGDGPVGTEEWLPQEPSVEQQEPLVDIEPYEQPDQHLVEMEQQEAQSAVDLEQPTEPNQEPVEEPPSAEYPEEIEQTSQPEEIEEISQPEEIEQTSQPEEIEQTSQPEEIEQTSQPEEFEQTSQPEEVEQTLQPEEEVEQHNDSVEPEQNYEEVTEQPADYTVEFFAE